MRASGASLAFALVLIAATPAAAQDSPYAVTAVPAALLRGNPDAIVRVDETTFDLASPGRATTTVKRAVTVLRASGREAAEMVLPYDRFRRVGSLSARLYDHSGRLVRRSERGDTGDYSAVSDGALFDDARVRTLSLSAVVPYTVEVEYRIDHDGVLGWPSWMPHDAYPVERSRFTLSAPEDLAVRMNVRGDIPTPTETTERGRRLRTWEVSALPAPTFEPFGPPRGQQLPLLRVAGSEFLIGGVRGSMATWADFGEFYAGMSRGRQALPGPARLDVARLVATLPDGTPDVAETARRLYRYAQAPDALRERAARHRRMAAVRRRLRPHPQLRRLQGPHQLPRRPARRSRRARLPRPCPRRRRRARGAGRVPEQPVQPRHPRRPDADRHALAGGDEPDAPAGPPRHVHRGPLGAARARGASHLVRLPRSPASANRQERHVRIDGFGTPDVTATVALRVTGNQADRVRDRLLAATPQERESWLIGTASVPVSRVASASFDGITAGSDTATVTARLRLTRFGTAAGSRTLLPLLLERWSFIPPAPTGERTQPVRYFPYAFEDTDTVEIALPAGLRLEAVPAPIEIETPFARYALRAAPREDGVLVVTRRLSVTGDALEPAQYEALRAFLTRVAAADNQQAVVVR